MPKFTPVSLRSDVNASRFDSQLWGSKTARAITDLPAGTQTFWGIPFEMPEGERDLIVFSDTSSIEITINVSGSHIVFAHFCDETASNTVAGQSSDYLNPVVTAPGEHLADYIVVYDNGTEHREQIRRRFEINQVQTRMQSGFSSRQHEDLNTLPFRGPYPDNAWGRWQTGVIVGNPPVSGRAAARDFRDGRSNQPGSWSIYALELPDSSALIKSVRIEPTGATAIAIGAITVFDGQNHPLQY